MRRRSIETAKAGRVSVRSPALVLVRFLIIGRPVDLVSRAALHPLLRAAVLEEARAVYAA